MNIFEENKGGSYAVFIKNGKIEYYHADNSWYLISHWNTEIENGKYFELIEKYRVEYNLFEVAIQSIKTKFEKNAWGTKLTWNLPVLIVNFDKNHLINNFPDQSLEDYVPENWRGEYVVRRKDFLKLIPEEFKYWKSIDLGSN